MKRLTNKIKSDIRRLFKNEIANLRVREDRSGWIEIWVLVNKRIELRITDLSFVENLGDIDIEEAYKIAESKGGKWRLDWGVIKEQEREYERRIWNEVLVKYKDELGVWYDDISSEPRPKVLIHIKFLNTKTKWDRL